MKYYGLLQSWNSNKNIEFSFSDSHKKTYQVNDSSQIETLKARLQERMRNSKNMRNFLVLLRNLALNFLSWHQHLQVVTQYVRQ